MDMQVKHVPEKGHQESPAPDIGVYTSSYAAARAAFLEQCEAIGAPLTSHLNPGHVGPDGEGLYCDVATLGNSQATRALLCTTATHGIEGTVGNAIFVNALRKGVFDEFLADHKIVLLHSINPWGHAYDSRCTENNVDLNRNFIDHQLPYPKKPDYLALHGVSTPANWSEQAFAEFMSSYEAMAAERGEATVVNALFGGQYERADGINFGGRGPEWSNTMLRRVIREQREGLEKAVLIDWHTGLGDYARLLYFCLDEPESPTYQRMHSWYGDEFLRFSRAFEGGKIPRYSGVMMNAVADEFSELDLCKLIIEFGTRPNADIFKAFLVDRWIRFGDNPDPEQVAELKAAMMECYCPTDQAWRAAVLEQSEDILRMSLEGLRGW